MNELMTFICWLLCVSGVLYSHRGLPFLLLPCTLSVTETVELWVSKIKYSQFCCEVVDARRRWVWLRQQHWTPSNNGKEKYDQNVFLRNEFAVKLLFIGVSTNKLLIISKLKRNSWSSFKWHHSFHLVLIHDKYLHKNGEMC